MNRPWIIKQSKSPYYKLNFYGIKFCNTKYKFILFKTRLITFYFIYVFKTYIYILFLWLSYDNFIKLVKIYFAIRNFDILMRLKQ